MSVLIKGMEMPVRCSGCDMEISYEYLRHECVLLYKGYTNDVRAFGRLKNCPLTEIPQKHGDLIDSDKLLKATVLNPVHVPYITIRDVKGMTAVIKAEGGD